MAELRKVLVIRLSSMGDVALCVPVLKLAMEQNPSVQFSLLTQKAFFPLFPFENLSLIEADISGKHKNIGGLLSLSKDLMKQNFDMVVDLHAVLRTHVIRSYLSLLSSNTASIDKGRKEKRAFIEDKTQRETPLKHTTERYADVFRAFGLEVNLDHQLKNFYNENSIKEQKTIGVAPFAKHEGKMYDLKKMVQVIRSLSINYRIELFGSAEELKKVKRYKLNDAIHFPTPNNTLLDDLQRIQGLSVMISMDSANMHLASACGVPVVSIWGVTHPYLGFLGYGQSLDWVIQDNAELNRPTSVYGNKLGSGDNPNCMGNIQPLEIIVKVESIIAI